MSSGGRPGCGRPRSGSHAKRPRLTYANIVSTLALFLALGGVAAYAASKVNSADLAKGAVHTSNVFKRTITSGKLAAGAVRSNQVVDGAIGSKQLGPAAVAPSNPRIPGLLRGQSQRRLGSYYRRVRSLPAGRWRRALDKLDLARTDRTDHRCPAANRPGCPGDEPPHHADRLQRRLHARLDDRLGSFPRARLRLRHEEAEGSAGLLGEGIAGGVEAQALDPRPL